VILGIDHIGLAVSDIEAASVTFSRLLGEEAASVEQLAAQQVRLCFVPNAAPNLELLEPLAPESATGRFLAKRGEGMHHVCFAVDDIEVELTRLHDAGFELIDRVARRGHGGLVAFVHPRAAHGVLVELLQRDP